MVCSSISSMWWRCGQYGSGVYSTLLGILGTESGVSVRELREGMLFEALEGSGSVRKDRECLTDGR